MQKLSASEWIPPLSNIASLVNGAPFTVFPHPNLRYFHYYFVDGFCR
ncbi:hypothetical protein SDJN02_26069, partial [Cucurbita argyrosperma subsp. argyrosperma]